jgi:hypothetical protein
MKRTALRSKPRPEGDKVTPEVYEHVMRRDGGCMAPRLAPKAGQCRDRWGAMVDRTTERALTLQHLWLDYSVKGKRAPSKPEHLIVMCWGHHEGTFWATSHDHLELQRDYLKDLITKGKA